MISNGFKELGLSEESLHAIGIKGFEEPTEIQKKIIPLILENKVDLIGQAQTGTGKTAAFALPIIEQETKAGFLQVLVLVPTRELAIQVSEEFNSLRGKKNLLVTPIYGGQSYDTQLRHLKKGIDVVVGTPGRVIDHLNRKTMLIDKVAFVVLDEADEMLNMGFIDDIEDILARTNSDRRTLLFSATMPDRIASLAKKYMGKREIIRTTKSGQTIDLTKQIYFEVKESDKFDGLCRIIDTTKEFYGLIFCRTKHDVDHVSSKLIDRGYDAEGLHGDISQNVRERILNKFRIKKINVLVATDVAARGLDIEELTHVINYALPQDPEAYLHRIGRTGRAGKEGTAITFVTPEEFRKLMYIKNSTQTEIKKERIPQVKDVIDFKKTKIAEEIKQFVEYGVAPSYVALAKDLIKNHNPEDIVAALIKYSFKDQLEEQSYAKIQDLFEGKKGMERSNTRSGDRNRFDRKGDRSSGNNRFERKGERDRNDRQYSISGTRNDKPRFRSDRSGSDDDVIKIRSERSGDEGGVRKDRSERSRFEDKGKARMFLALGKKDNLDAPGLLKMLKKKANIDPEKVTGIQISDAFSFFNITPKESNIVLEKLNKEGGHRPIVERAKTAKR
jgi:ATP-dependent RNA helicase DeaD